MVINRIRWTATAALAALLCAVGASGCSDDGSVGSEEEARRAYMGLDRAVGLAMDLGFRGFNAATSANIPLQSDDGQIRGVIEVGGKVDQGSSDNKEMRLEVGLATYTDTPPAEAAEVTYDTVGAPAILTLSLKKIPNGTLSGSLTGGFRMSGGLEGDVSLSLTLAGQLEPDPASAGGVRRKPGTTAVTGTASSPYGTFAVNLTL